MTSVYKQKFDQVVAAINNFQRNKAKENGETNIGNIEIKSIARENDTNIRNIETKSIETPHENDTRNYFKQLDLTPQVNSEQEAPGNQLDYIIAWHNKSYENHLGLAPGCNDQDSIEKQLAAIIWDWGDKEPSEKIEKSVAHLILADTGDTCRRNFTLENVISEIQKLEDAFEPTSFVRLVFSWDTE